MPKVFISHSWEDNEISRKLAKNLKRDGAEIWIDFRKIKAGDSFINRMNEGLELCDTLVLGWSINAANSKYVNMEWSNSVIKGMKIIPCVIDHTKFPIILSDLLYIDFYNFNRGYQKLARALNLTIKPPKIQPSKPAIIKKQLPKKRDNTGAILIIIFFLIILFGYVAYKYHFIFKQEPPETTFNDTDTEQIPIPIYNSQTKFRAYPCELSPSEYRDIFNKYNSYWQKYELINKQVVYDHNSGLMWQLGGSESMYSYEDSKKYYIENLKFGSFADYNDWRLPTLEEAISLMESEKTNDLYIDPIFDRRQILVWTADEVKNMTEAWVADFESGNCHTLRFHFDRAYVRAVRSVQSSQE